MASIVSNTLYMSCVSMICVGFIGIPHTESCTFGAHQIAADIFPKIIYFWREPSTQSPDKIFDRMAGTVSVNITQVLNTVDERFLSVAMDSDLIKEGWKAFDFNSDKLKNMARALSPLILRIGGTAADFVLFNDTISRDMSGDTLPVSYKKYHKKDYGDNFTMTVDDWDNINKFSAEVGWDVLFDFNMLLRNGSLWDSTNAQSLLKYTTQRGYRIAGWELGNEPNHIDQHSNVTIDADQLGRDFVSLRRLLNTHGFQDSFLVGPDVTNPTIKNPNVGIEGADVIGQEATVFLKSFLSSCGNSTYATTWHSYSLDGKKAFVDNFTDPRVMDDFIKQTLVVQKLVHKYRPYMPKIWIGETAGAYGGGAPGLSDAYAGGFLWLDKLGIAAKYGVDLVIRQSFYSGHYGLLNKELNPTPVYWLSALYKKLVGPIVLNVNISVEGSRDSDDLSKNPEYIRAYAHCTNNKTRLRSANVSGSITLFIINLQPKHHATLKLGGDLAHKSVYQYLLSPHSSENNITATRVNLNGEKLKLTGNNRIPPLDGQPLKLDEPINVPPLTFGFFVIESNVSLCR